MGPRNLPTNENSLQPVMLAVTAADIEQMEKHCCRDSVVFSPEKNAIVFALERVLKPGAGPVRVELAGDCAVVYFGEESFSLGESLGNWLEWACRESHPAPVKEIVWLPREKLRASVRQLPVVKAI